MSLKGTAKAVLDLIETGSYQTATGRVSIEQSQREAQRGSQLYTPGDCEALRAQSTGGSPTIEVRDATTQIAGKELAELGPVVMLNFASARNPGGGFLNGAKAQEEDLCRCSGLYPTLTKHPTYYQVNRKQSSMIYTDHMIYSPGVPFFKTRGTGDLLEAPFRASVITAPAPNSAPHLQRHPGDHDTLEEAFERRWRNVLAIARDQGQRTVLLGAWGCGAFGGDPAMAARTAKKALDAEGDFDRVVFAIPDSGRRSARNFAVFKETLG